MRLRRGRGCTIMTLDGSEVAPVSVLSRRVNADEEGASRAGNMLSGNRRSKSMYSPRMIYFSLSVIAGIGVWWSWAGGSGSTAGWDRLSWGCVGIRISSPSWGSATGSADGSDILSSAGGGCGAGGEVRGCCCIVRAV